MYDIINIIPQCLFFVSSKHFSIVNLELIDASVDFKRSRSPKQTLIV